MEFVYVLPRHELFKESYPQGFRTFDEELSLEQFEACVGKHGFFVERDYAERTPTLKQVIPYCIIVRRETDNLSVL